jgi:hypothetical protein
MTREDVVLSLVKSGELEIDCEGLIWRVATRHGRGPKRGTSEYETGSRVSPCERRRTEHQTEQGYLQVKVMVAGKKTIAAAHRVVWVHFNGPIPDGLTINHKDGNKANNRPSNLEPATMSEQRIHAITVLNVDRNRPKGSLNPKSRLTEDQVLAIRGMRTSGMMAKDIAEHYRIDARVVSQICTRRTWQHI